MKISYVLHENAAESLHNLYSISPLSSFYVGIYGHKRYTSVVESHTVVDEIWSETALPFSFCLSGVSVTDACSILRAYVHNKTGLEWDTCEVTKYDDFVLVYPIIDEEYVYLNDNESLELTIDTSMLAGRCLLTRHSLARISVRNMFWMFEIEGVTTFGSVMKELLSSTEINDRIYSVDYDVVAGIQSGTVAIDKGSDLMYRLLSELAHVWGIEKSESPNSFVFTSGGSVLSKSMSCSLSRWVNDSVYRLMLGKPPRVPLVGTWMQRSHSGDVRTLLTYCCRLAARYSSKDIVVTPGLVVYAPLWGPKDYVEFRDSLEGYARNMDSYYIHYVGDREAANLVRANAEYDAVLIGDKIVTTSSVLVSEQREAAAEEEREEEVGWEKYLMDNYGIESVLL